jgi:SNF family Na+-dependent transporter
MPAGGLFGFLFFFLLFLAAVTSSLSMLQPGIAFVEEALDINRRQSVAILGVITAFGCAFVVYFSKDVKALDTLDFWVGTFLIYILATIQIIIFGWVLGIDKGFEEAHRGSAIRIPRFFGFIMKWICPAFLLLIFSTWVIKDVVGLGAGDPDYHILDLFGETANTTAWLSIGVIAIMFSFVAILVSRVKKYRAVYDQPLQES